MDTKYKIIRAAKEEFLLKGYSSASVRTICKNAGVTTGALYFLFENKEKLFNAIVAPLMNQWAILSQDLFRRELENPESANENERKMMSILYQQKDIVILAMEKAEGTEYENMPQQLEAMLKSYFREYFEANMNHKVEDKLITILVQWRIQSYMTILKGSKSQKEALELSENMACYADAGTKALINQLNKLNEKNPIES